MIYKQKFKKSILDFEYIFFVSGSGNDNNIWASSYPVQSQRSKKY